MWCNRRIPKALCVAAAALGLSGCGVNIDEANTWGDQVANWAAAVSAAVCMLEEAVYDAPSTTGGADAHTHTHPVPNPANRYCPPGPPPDPVVPPPGPPDFGG